MGVCEILGGGEGFPNVVKIEFNGIVQSFELAGVTRLIRSAIINWRSGKFFKKNLMIQSHNMSLYHFQQLKDF
jgi:hypothetical protein